MILHDCSIDCFTPTRPKEALLLIEPSLPNQSTGKVSQNFLNSNQMKVDTGIEYKIPSQTVLDATMMFFLCSVRHQGI
jgi:hypothetical protein